MSPVKYSSHNGVVKRFTPNEIVAITTKLGLGVTQTKCIYYAKGLPFDSEHVRTAGFVKYTHEQSQKTGFIPILNFLQKFLPI